MDLVTLARAQDAAQETANSGNWLFILVGLGLGVLALVMIFKQFNVSSGHAIVLGVAVGVGCLPYIANFEWTKDGFKFTTKIGSQLTEQVEALNKSEAEIRENLKAVNQALHAATTRLAALEQGNGGPDGGPALSPPGPGSAEGKLDPSLFEDLITRNEAAIRMNEQRLNEIGALRQQLQMAQ